MTAHKPLTDAEIQTLRDGATHPRSPLSLEDVIVVQRLVDDLKAARAVLVDLRREFKEVADEGEKTGTGCWANERIERINAALPPGD